MDNAICNKVQPVVRKVKKKQAKGELDHLKLAEKKKRRLKKALVTSAAIRSELENKIAEQQRLDEEGAAIAEAVALHVLLGEDYDDPCRIMLNKEEGFNPWHCAKNLDLLMGGRTAYLPHRDPVNFPLEGLDEQGYKSVNHESGDRSLPYSPIERILRAPYFDDAGWVIEEFSADRLAAQAVSSLQIAEDAQ